MLRSEFFEIAGYFANPARISRIEIEGRRTTVTAYDAVYTRVTGTSIPVGEGSVTLLEDDANKWGREMRLYFVLTDEFAAPQIIRDQMTVCGRNGYEQWTNRLNSRSLIDDLISIGFRLGHPQNVAGIQALIPAEDLIDFQRGFAIP